MGVDINDKLHFFQKRFNLACKNMKRYKGFNENHFILLFVIAILSKHTHLCVKYMIERLLNYLNQTI